LDLLAVEFWAQELAVGSQTTVAIVRAQELAVLRISQTTVAIVVLKVRLLMVLVSFVGLAMQV